MKTNKLFLIMLFVFFVPNIMLSQDKKLTQASLFPIKLKSKWGFIDKTGEIIIQPEYDNVEPFVGGLARIELNKKYGFIDISGKLCIDAEYDLAYDFSEGFAVVSIDDKYGFIDTKGKNLTEIIYDECSSFSEGLAKVKINGKYGFIDKTGKIKIEPRFEIVGDFSEGLAGVVMDGKVHYIDLNGKVITKQGYDRGSDFSEGLACVRIEENIGYINKKGEITIDFKYPYGGHFIDGLARVSIKTLVDSKYGFIDKTSKLVIEPRFEDAEDFSEGLASVKLFNKWGCIDKEGNVVVDFIFGYLYPFSEGRASFMTVGTEVKEIFAGRIITSTLGEKFGFINNKGEIVIEPKFDYAGSFSNGLSKVTIGNEIRYIDKTGNYVWPPNEAALSVQESSKRVDLKANKELIKEAQGILKELDYYKGDLDGLIGPNTTNAIKSFQRDNDIFNTGQLDITTMNELRFHKPPTKIINWDNLKACGFIKERTLRNKIKIEGAKIKPIESEYFNLASGLVRGGIYDALGIGSYVLIPENEHMKMCDISFSNCEIWITKRGFEVNEF